MKYLAIALATAALVGAQTPAVNISPNSSERAPSVGSGRGGMPILGYLAGPGPVDLHVVVGSVKTARLGESVPVPADAKRLFLPPRQHYALVEGTGGEALSVWHPTQALGGEKSAGRAIVGAMAHPDMVAFSARGEAAVVYAKSGDLLQVMRGLPGEPTVLREPAIGALGEALAFAVSDDGAVVVAELADGSAFTSKGGGGWQSLAGAYGARQMLFVPKTHDLVVSDVARRMVLVLPAVGEAASSARLLAQSIEADRLAFTKEGDQLMAASSSQGKLWAIDVKSGSVGPGSVALIDTLVPLRDGRTFLLSNSKLLLLNMPTGGDVAVGLAPVSR